MVEIPYLAWENYLHGGRDITLNIFLTISMNTHDWRLMFRLFCQHNEVHALASLWLCSSKLRESYNISLVCSTLHLMRSKCLLIKKSEPSANGILLHMEWWPICSSRSHTLKFFASIGLCAKKIMLGNTRSPTEMATRSRSPYLKVSVNGFILH